MSERCIQPDVKPDARTDPLTPVQAANVLRLWDGFADLVLTASSVHFHRLSDLVDVEDRREWSVTVLPQEGGKRLLLQAGTFLELVTKLVDGNRQKICKKCHESKMMTSFSIDRTQADGRCRNCRKCEAIRVVASQKKRRERERARKAAEAQEARSRQAQVAPVAGEKPVAGRPMLASV